MKNFLLGVFLFIIAQVIIWFQTNSQFIWDWPRKNPIWIAIITATPAAYILIMATNYMAAYYHGELWPVRIVGFSIGILIFALMTKYWMGQGLDLKTIVSICIAAILILIQIYWK